MAATTREATASKDGFNKNCNNNNKSGASNNKANNNNNNKVVSNNNCKNNRGEFMLRTV